MSPHLERAFHLMGQGRLELAEADFRRALAEDPDDPVGHAALALCLSAAQRGREAEEEARAAVGLGPDYSFAHYALARVYFDQDRYPPANRAIDEAIALDPEDADYRALKANLRLQASDWKGALEAAEEGLRLDARNTLCANLRSMALVKLGRKAEAEAALTGVLSQDPENALSHANQGWTQLERNDPTRAMEHFREALRIDPELDWARAGMVEALKARNPVYRVLLRYFLWMGKLSEKAQWVVIIGLLVGRRVLQQVAKHFPESRPFVIPAIVALLLFFYMTWVSGPLFNLTLRLNRFGWYALTNDQRRASLWVGLSYLLALVSGLAALALWLAGSPLAGACLMGVVFGMIVVIPISATYQAPTGWPRVLTASLTVALALIGLGSIGLEVLSELFDWGGWASPLVLPAALIFLIGCGLSTWLGVILPKVK
jgi:tetratricopeptide (TPR) repeat protein